MNRVDFHSLPRNLKNKIQDCCGFWASAPESHRRIPSGFRCHEIQNEWKIYHEYRCSLYQRERQTPYNTVIVTGLDHEGTYPEGYPFDSVYLTHEQSVYDRESDG